jgi:serine/threonine protein kinase
VAGRRVGQYEIIREVARGGFAIVYLATQLGLDRYVALKELLALQASDLLVVERFLRESRMAGSLNHPNIVTVHEYFEHEGTPYISMEYLERGALRPLMDKLTFPQICGVLEGVLAGLAHAEKKGIVHRDLKPENLMVTSDGGIKIADFGIAKAAGQLTSNALTATGMTIGTPAYMAPEQAMARPIGPWTDLYSVGVIAFELLLGRVPFEDLEYPLAVLYRHIHDPVPPPLSIRPDLGPGIARWIERLLLKEPSERYQRAVDAWEDLEESIIEILGPRWRRGARIAELPAGPEDDRVAKSLSPAPFPMPSPPPAPALSSGERDLRELADGTGQVEKAGVAAREYPEETHDGSEPKEGEDLLTVPPTPRPNAVSKESAKASKGRFLRIPPFVWVAMVLALASGGVGLTAFVGNSEERKREEVPSEVTPYVAAPSDRISLALSGDLYVAHPSGRVARLNSTTLEPLATLRHPPAPQALAVGAKNIYAADTNALTEIGAEDLAPMGAAELGGDPIFLAGGDGRPLVSAAVIGPDKGRVCQDTEVIPTGAVPGPDSLPGFELIQAGKLHRSCVDVPFTPTGLGTQGDVAYVADDKGGTVVPITSTGGSLTPGKPIKVGRNPHGTFRDYGGKLYVPVTGGIAVLDPGARKLDRTVPLTSSPAAIWLIAADGRLVVLLPDRGEVVLINTASPEQGKQVVKVEGRPVAIGAAKDGADSGFVYVATADNGTIHRLNTSTGKLEGSKRVPGIDEGPVEPVAVRDGTFSDADGMLKLTLFLETGVIDRRNIRITDPQIADGRAVVELRQAGIASKVDRLSDKGVTAELSRGPSHLLIALLSDAKLVGEVSGELAVDGKSLVLKLGRVEPQTPPQVPRPAQTLRSAPTRRPPTVTRVITIPRTATTTRPPTITVPKPTPTAPANTAPSPAASPLDGAPGKAAGP